MLVFGAKTILEFTIKRDGKELVVPISVSTRPQSGKTLAQVNSIKIDNNKSISNFDPKSNIQDNNSSSDF